MTDKRSQNLTPLVSQLSIDGVFEKKKKKFVKNFQLKLHTNNQERVQRFASLARVVAETSSERKEICCCFYVDEQKKFWYSTNRGGETDNKTSYQQFCKKIHDGTIDIPNYLLEKNEEKFLWEVFLGYGKNYRKIRQTNFSKIQKKIKALDWATNLSQQDKNDQYILKLVSDSFYQYELLPPYQFQLQSVLEHFSDVKTKIENYFQSLSSLGEREKKPEATELVFPVCSYIEDYLNIYQIHKEKDFIEAFHQKQIFWYYDRS